MLRLRFQASLAAMALCIAAPGHAQGGLDGRLHAAEQKLAQNSQSCVPINLGEYADLLREAAENKLRANKAAKKGVPVDQAQVDADLAKASALFNQAMSKLTGQCMQAARQQARAPGTSAKPMSDMEVMESYFAARRRCDIGAMTDAASREEWWLKYTVQAKQVDVAGDVKRCTSQGPTGSGTSPAPPYDPKYVTQPQLGTGPRTEQAQSIDPDQYGPVKIADPASVGGPLSPFAKEVLETHNKARAEYGAPPLKWDEGLVGGAVGAAAFAQQLARAGKMVHAPREGRGKVRENISQGLPWWSTRQLMENWTKEKAKFKPGRFPYVSNTGNWYEVGHWAQMIWINTVLIGCARAVGTAASWLVCRYSPGGNRDGELVGVPPTTNLASRDGTIEAPKLPDKEVFHAGAGRLQDSFNIDLEGPYAELLAEIFTLNEGEYFDVLDQLSGIQYLNFVSAIRNNSFVLDSFLLDEDEKIELETALVNYGYVPPMYGGFDLGAFRNMSNEPPMDWTMTGIYDLLGAMPKTVDEPGQPTADTKVEQPQFPNTEVYKQLAKQEPTNPPRCTSPYHAGMNAGFEYEDAKKKDDTVMMAAAKADFADAITQQRQIVESIIEAGEMAETNKLAEMTNLLNYMIYRYEGLTGERMDEGEGPSGLSAPELPPTEVFKPDGTLKCGEVM